MFRRVTKLVLNEGEHLMLEINLFVNPLGRQCLRCEYDVLKVDRELTTKVSYRFIPFFNMATIQQTIELYHLDQHDLRVRQTVSNTIYRVILDYLAASFQGKRRGRQFLLSMQTALIKNDNNYSSKLAEEIAQQVNLDLDMFLDDRCSPLVKRTFKEEQQIAKRLGVTQPSTAVVFDSNQSQYGFLLHDFDYETLVNAYQNNELENEFSIAGFIKKHQSQPQTRFIQK